MRRALKIGTSVLVFFSGLFVIHWMISRFEMTESLTGPDLVPFFLIGWPLVATACFLTLVMELYYQVGAGKRR